MENIKTDYIVDDIPHFEYPRPQMVRESYMTLNGWWDLCVTSRHKEHKEDYVFSKRIKVPFSPESDASGIGKGFVLKEDQKLVYNRNFEISKEFDRGRVILHFGAVDQYCVVFINGAMAGSHRGGYTSFELDITEYIDIGSNTITVECIDDTENSEGARGKQSSTPGGIWYTAQSGIWQSVWLESVPEQYVRSLKINVLPDLRSVDVLVDYEGKKTITVFDQEKEIISVSTNERNAVLSYDYELWSPEHPKLYDLVIECDSGDIVRSYFGVRTFGIGCDNKGVSRLLLNGTPYFYNGILDQGYWPEGLLTPPSDKAILDELVMLKEMGFNMIRKHIKIESMRWYYYCDVLGITVWQDFVNGGGKYSFTHTAAFPFLGFKHNDSDYKYFSRESKQGRDEYWKAVFETVDSLYNCTCISAWVPFNEGWGQFDSAEITGYVKRIDPSRIVDSVSGWHDQGVGNTDLKSLHIYYTPLKLPKDPRPIVLSEFGGYSLKLEGHVFNNDKEFGYRKYKTKEELYDALKVLYVKKLAPLIAQGLCACVYTQVSDVEEEINGLISYDRKVKKISEKQMRRINEYVLKEALRLVK